MAIRSPLRRAALLMEEWRKLDAELPAQIALALLMIAQDEGATQSEIAVKLGASKSGIQRIFDRLSDKGGPGLEGYRLIEVRPGMEDARLRQAFLTAKGRRFVASIENLMEG